MNPSATSTCKHKYKELEAIISDSDSSVPVKFVAITETWLQDHIKDAQLTIEGFDVTRCDRGDRGGGGVLLYSHQSYPISEEECAKYDDSYCLALFVKFITLKLGVFVVYRPPEAPREKFLGVLAFVQKCMDEQLDRSFQVCVVGDFNFPDIDWHSEKVLSGQTVDSQDSAREFLRFLNSKFMNQYVDRPTRDSNILDLFCADNPSLVQSLTVSQPGLSDHSLVSVLISIPVTELDGVPKRRALDDGFASLDFSRADYTGINEAIGAVDWNWLQLEYQHDLQDYPAIFTKILLDICKEHVPAKRPTLIPRKLSRPREVNALRRKK